VQPPLELHGLEPIPQPEQVEAVREAPAYSILPAWQEHPLIVPPESNTEFASFGFAEVLAGNLRRTGLHRPLPIQATVLPLLLRGPDKHAGDLCISAATGSGKTLLYVLPIIAALKDLAGTKLRAVVVVPTRELVKQVRDLCEACAAGTSIKFATAVGSKSLHDEQQMLVKEEKVYDPEEYAKWQQSPVDWSNFSLATLAQKAKEEDPLYSVGYMTQYRSKVDVLITTPGRLVDHLRSTAGFTLDHLAWLVVDEADRLLNESYQEWVAVVKPALESQAATQKRDDLLRHMGMTPPKRRVTKILLSATMTRDLSKLNALGLHNPKLVVLGGNKAGKNGDNAGTPAPDAPDAVSTEMKDKEIFHLPETLKEIAIPVPDGSEKPLFLLELVRNHIGITAPLLKPSTNARGGLLDTSLRSDSTPESSSSSEEASSSDEERSSVDSASHSKGISGQTKAAAAKRTESQRHDKAPRALIFARSTASAERLSRLLCLLDPQLAPQISTLTRSTASSASSRRALASFRNSKISILIATDRASRGLDVRGLEHVVSYDVPNSALTYVHRVGRTARAGRGGQAWTLVEHREGAWFWREIGGKRKQPAPEKATAEPSIHREGKVSKLQLSLEHSELRQRYEEALRQLGEEVLAKP
jgi:ATP-dependent RNA helicase DDX51/DBP6